mgnify:CR=1 FL=1
MKKVIAKSVLAALVVVSLPSIADRVTVNGKTYECSNSCSVNLGPPTTISDCCGGTIAEILRPGAVIEIGT